MSECFWRAPFVWGAEEAEEPPEKVGNEEEEKREKGERNEVSV